MHHIEAPRSVQLSFYPNMSTTFSDLRTEIRQRILLTAVSSAARNSENLRLARIESVNTLEKVRKTKGWVWGVNADNVANNGTAFTAEIPITTIPDEAPSELEQIIDSLISRAEGCIHVEPTSGPVNFLPTL